MTGREMTVAVRTAVLQRKPLCERRETRHLLSTHRTVALVALMGLVEAAWIALLFELVVRAV
jgi:hypothetical protein